MSFNSRQLRARAVAPSRRFKFDSIAMLLYLLIVYVWALGTYPMGRDYAMLTSGGEGISFLSRGLLMVQLAVFGDWAAGYHIVNLVLLYACMLALYRFITLTIKGPAWLGVLAANLFMANPLHTEAVLNISGSLDLIPCLLALITLQFYAEWVEEPVSNTAKAIGMLVITIMQSTSNAYLPLVLLLYEGLITGSHRRSKVRIALCGIALLGSLVYHHDFLLSSNYDIAAMYVPLYFTFYCIGFLPENVLLWQQHPWTGWLVAAIVILILILIHAKARRPAYMFAILSILALRLAPDQRPIDPVHLIGGGQLLVPQALLMFAVASLYLRGMDHPKWRHPLILSSFSVSIIFFVMQGVSNWHWIEAGHEVRAFQEQAAAMAEKHPGETLAVVPDFQYYRGAPLCLSESISHDTPFSASIDHKAYMPLHYQDGMSVEIVEWTAHEGVVQISGVKPIEIVPYPFDSLAEYAEGEAMRFSVTPETGALPQRIVSLHVEGQN